MKTPHLIPLLVVIGILSLGGNLNVFGGAAGKAFSAASGKYKGKARGRISSQVLATVTPIQKSDSFVKLPRGKGRFLANFGGVKIKGKVRKASVRQSGKKVSIIATGILPSTLTAPLMSGPGNGTFRGTVKLRGKVPKLTGKGVFGVPNLIQLNARFSGEK